MRKRLYTIVEQGRDNDWVSYIYDFIILAAITASIIPLMFIETYPVFKIIENVTVGLLLLDYVLRWIGADYIVGKGKWSFLLYPITPWAIIDFLSILPGLNILGQGFKVLRISRLLRILRLFKFIRYSQNIKTLGNVIRREKKILFTVLGIAVFYIFVSALVMFNAEPHINPETGQASFENFFDALYWATVTLTTVGYGDVTPVTDIGRFISMVSSLFGVAIIALPSGVITAAYIEELRAQKKD
jgi:voltage-gated potassium channel